MINEIIDFALAQKIEFPTVRGASPMVLKKGAPSHM